MMAWISPSLTVRSTPRRICLLPWSVSTLTSRPEIWRVDMVLPHICRRSGVDARWDGVDVHVVVDDGHGEYGHRLVGREGEGATGLQVEARAVGPALQRVVLDEALGERDVA